MFPNIHLTLRCPKFPGRHQYEYVLILEGLVEKVSEGLELKTTAILEKNVLANQRQLLTGKNIWVYEISSTRIAASTKPAASKIFLS